MKQPEKSYQMIEGAQWRHIWVVGDIHGCFALLMAKLRACRFDPWQDLLVSVGDLIDRGPDSLRCLQLLLPLFQIVGMQGFLADMRLHATDRDRQMNMQQVNFRHFTQTIDMGDQLVDRPQGAGRAIRRQQDFHDKTS